MKKLSAEQIARMTPEVRAKYEKKLHAIKRNRKILGVFVAVIVVAAVCITLSVTVLFNISQIKVEKTGSFYTSDQIISASGLDAGDNIIRTDFDSVAKRIETNLPYVLSVKIQKSLSGIVKLSITDDKASIIFKAENGYAVADENGKVLEVLEKEPEKTNFIVLKTSKTMTASPGQVIAFADNDEETLYNNIKTALAAQGIKNITGIDISDPTNVYVEYQHRLRLHIGSPTQLDDKFEAAVKTIKMEDESNPNSIAEINLTIVKKVYVKPLDSLEEETTTESEEATNESEETTSESEKTTELQEENNDTGDEEE